MVRSRLVNRIQIEILLMIFKMKDSNNPIWGVPDAIPGFFYRTCPKGLFDRRVIVESKQGRLTTP